jgi:hypothetical protein
MVDTETDELYLEIRILLHVLAKTAMHALEQRLGESDAHISGLQFAIMRALSLKAHRRVPLSLTERGLEWVSCVPIVDEDDPVAKSLNALSEEQRHQLLTLLRELVRNLQDGDDILRRVSSRVHIHPSRVPTGD